MNNNGALEIGPLRKVRTTRGMKHQSFFSADNRYKNSTKGNKTQNKNREQNYIAG
jgi:hypothetical protein